MKYREIINNLEAIPYSKYKEITSYEKLMIYSASVLEEKNIPITFNYLCVATFKLFPDAFCLDEEFKEFPSVDRLNRTVMHLKYVKNGKPYIAGSVKTGYSLTSYGYAVAEEIQTIINHGKVDLNVKAPAVDQHKKGYSKDYLLFISGDGYKKYIENGIVDNMYIWEFYNRIPFTQIKRTKKDLKDILEYAKENNDEKCINYIEKILVLL